MDLSCQGSRFYRTPNVDSLACNGMTFTDGYSACPVSSPTRAALMTGKYPARLHITDFIPGRNFPWAPLIQPDWNRELPIGETTIAQTLGRAGYATWHVGKWHLGRSERYYPEYRGFEINIGGGSDGAPGSGGKYFAPFNFRNLTGGETGEYLTDRLTREAVELIEKRDPDKPFYLNMAHYAVHLPLQAPEEGVARYIASVDENSSQRSPVYAAMVEAMDRSLGAIVDALRRNGIEENTMLIFTSDNGALYSVSGREPLRGGKGAEFEGGVRVPFIVRWTGHVPAGSHCNTPVITMDIPATIMDISGSGLSALDGRSLLPLFAGGTLPERPLYWHFPHYNHTSDHMFTSMRLGDWKLIEYLEDNSLQLYNLRDDLGETRNMASSDPARARRMKSMLYDWRSGVGAQMPAKNPDYDPARAKRQKK
jgi:arylsulfatase A-like enzyme